MKPSAHPTHPAHAFPTFMPHPVTHHLPCPRRLVLAVLAASVLGGCAISEPVLRPTMSLSASWSEPADTSAASIPDTWWQSFGSPQLDALIAEAMLAAPDLLIQGERVVQAELALRQSGASLLPTLSLAGSSGVLVNGKPVNLPSYQVKAGDAITLSEKVQKQLRVQEALTVAEQHDLTPSWIEVDSKKFAGVFKAVPDRADLPADINEALIVELYSK